MTEQTYHVRFIGDFFATTVSVIVDPSDPATPDTSEDAIIDLANNIMREHYGWDVQAVAAIDIDVQEG